MKSVLVAAAAVAFAGSASAIPVLDGAGLTTEYGAAIASNSTGTGFGNNSNELNALYATSTSSTLYLGIAGNIGDFNRISLFFDTDPNTGENVVSGSQTPFNFNFGNFSNYTGMTFDADFTADYYLDFTAGGGGFFGSLDLLNGGSLEIAGMSGTGTNGGAIASAYDGSNTGGVADGPNTTPDTDPLTVDTGLELAVELSELGLAVGDEVKIMVLINNGGLDFLSNQTLGGLPTDFGNLAGPSTANFANFAGDQFGTFTIIPTPGAAALIGLAGLAAARRRR